MDRLAACWYHNDPQCWEQAVMVCRDRVVDWDELHAWALGEGRNSADIDRLRTFAEAPGSAGSINGD